MKNFFIVIFSFVLFTGCVNINLQSNFVNNQREELLLQLENIIQKKWSIDIDFEKLKLVMNADIKYVSNKNLQFLLDGLKKLWTNQQELSAKNEKINALYEICVFSNKDLVIKIEKIMDKNWLDPPNFNVYRSQIYFTVRSKVYLKKIHDELMEKYYADLVKRIQKTALENLEDYKKK